MAQITENSLTFFPFTQNNFERLKEADLSAAEWRLWAYLVSLIPFGDRFVDLPDTSSILAACQISKSAFYRAIDKIRTFKLFEFQDKGFQAKNLCYSWVRKSEKEVDSSSSQNWETCPRIGKPVPELGNLSQNWENESPEPLPDKDRDRSQTIQIDQISHTADPESERENFSEMKIQEKSTNEEYIEASAVNNAQNQEEPKKPEKPEKPETDLVQKSSVKEKSSAAISPKKIPKVKLKPVEPQPQILNWIPDGPWCIDGKLDPNFIDAIARDWIGRFGGDLNQRRADVLSHLKKDPANFAIRWQQYADNWLQRYQNTQIQLQRGFEIEADYQQRLLENHRAITESLPDDLNPIADPPPPPAVIVPPTPAIAPEPKTEPNPTADNEPTQPSTEDSEPTPAASTPEQNPTPEPQPTQPPTEDNDPDRAIKEQIAGYRKFVSDWVKSRKNPQKDSKNLAEKIDKLNDWIQDPLLRSEALREIAHCDRLTCLFDEEGNPCKVIEITPEEADGAT